MAEARHPSKPPEGGSQRPAHRPTPPTRYRAPQHRSSRPVWLIPTILGLLVVLLLVFEARRNAAPNQASPAVTTSVIHTMTTLPAAAYNTAGTAGTTSGSLPILLPTADRASGAPTLLYMGAEYCPYCAAERWVLVSALSRFGSFSGLALTESSSTDVYPDTPTFTFLHASFQGPPVTVQTVEMQNRSQQPLQTPTAAQNALISKYDAPPYIPAGENAGSIPFILIGGRYVWNTGSQYNPGILAGLNWSKVASDVASGTTVGRTILANANILSAAICAVDGGQPANVCTSPGVRAGARALPTTPSVPGGSSSASGASG